MNMKELNKCGICGGNIGRSESGANYKCNHCNTEYVINKKFLLVTSIFAFNVLIICFTVEPYIIASTIGKKAGFGVTIIIICIIYYFINYIFELTLNKYFIRKFIKKKEQYF